MIRVLFNSVIAAIVLSLMVSGVFWMALWLYEIAGFIAGSGACLLGFLGIYAFTLILQTHYWRKRNSNTRTQELKELQAQYRNWYSTEVGKEPQI
jgi:hypothetical protein